LNSFLFIIGRHFSLLRRRRLFSLMTLSLSPPLTYFIVVISMT
jgi:hypothetical protein